MSPPAGQPPTPRRRRPRRSTAPSCWLAAVACLSWFVHIAAPVAATVAVAAVAAASATPLETLPACLTAPGQRASLMRRPRRWSEAETKRYMKTMRVPEADWGVTRMVASNHKTGTMLAECIAHSVCKSGGVRCLSAHLQSSSGHGMIASSFSANMVRNPFTIVHSGLEYHSRTTNKNEKWLFKPVNTLGRILPPAVRMYNNICQPGRVNVSLASSYQEMVKGLELRDALLLEALRALRLDIPSVLAAARRCVSVDATAGAAVARTGGSAARAGGCVNVPLDAIMANFTAGFYEYLHPALQFAHPEEAAARFASRCNPSSANASAADRAHMSAHHGAERERAIAILRELDKRHLDGVLHDAEAELLSLADPPSNNSLRRRQGPPTAPGAGQ